jgi:hypothetical protein
MEKRKSGKWQPALGPDVPEVLKPFITAGWDSPEKRLPIERLWEDLRRVRFAVFPGDVDVEFIPGEPN